MTDENTQVGTGNQPEPPDEKGNPAKPPLPKIHLHDTKSIRKEAARVYREARQGVIEVAVGSKLVHMLGVLSKMHELSVIEERLKALESRQS